MYQKGTKILLADLNSFINTVGAVYGVGQGDRGYGQIGVSSAPATGGFVTAAPWERLRSMIAVCAAHQGTSVSTLVPSTEFRSRAVVKAHETDSPSANPYDINSHVAAVEANRLVAPPSSMQLVSGAHTVIRASAWPNSIEAVVDAAFPNEDAARFFFNSGGEIRLRLSHLTGSAQDNTLRTALNTNVGTIKLNAHAVTNTGSRAMGHATGFYELQSADTLLIDGSNVATGGDAGAYAYAYGGTTYAMNLAVRASVLNRTGTNGGNGSTVRFTVSVSNTYTGTINPMAAGTTLNIDVYRANVHLLGIPAPTFTTVTAF